jgi:hypothetical protein
LLLRLLGLCGGEIDFVDDGNDREIVLRREERVGDSLRLDALACIHHQQRAFASGKRARNFIGKIDVAGRVNQVELVLVSILRLVVKTNALGFDGDAALALEVHRVEHLRAHLPLAERTGKLKQTVGQRGLAVVNVRDDAKIADETWVHQLACRRAVSQAGKSLLSEAISGRKSNSSLPNGILEPLRNNSVCHKRWQSGSGAAKSEVGQYRTIPPFGTWDDLL